MYLLYIKAVPLDGSFAPEWGTQCGCDEFWLYMSCGDDSADFDSAGMLELFLPKLV